ncbi:MAG: HIT family protein [Eubacteriales bacterium]|nr:HIT family protein [Eubacteriales bacterium]
MEKDKACMYCNPDERQAGLMFKVTDLSVTELFFFKEQSHPGRCIVAYKHHAKEIFDLPVEDQTAFIADIARAAQAIQTVFNPDKINYGAFGDRNPSHLHMHLVPKYEDQFEWGSVFAMNPQQVYLTDAEYSEAIDKLKRAL